VTPLVAETIADRLEGKSVQKVKEEGSHRTVFYETGDRHLSPESRHDSPSHQSPPSIAPSWRMI
jgi:hypothetical protein